MRKVYRLIRQLGMTSKYKGYYYVAEAVMMSMELQDYPIKITKDIYPYLAKKFKSTPVNIEHDIRTVINVCWTANKESMDRIAGYPLRYRPTNSEFVDMLAYYLIQTELDSDAARQENSQNLTACQNPADGVLSIPELQNPI
ncbi:sporulation initiation factor Spo0A C-terminal domain-containing protein [Blautia sp. MSJ-19]|uniref:sporulation initiation factor Spo0A C-terminal domain-containing protein n=1 Tax=Blautia sp. MSJ-19 TaxID=2841517 RepID=UPI0020A18723|nr:sporulation initiation factor Spo0A C-terminal domain-containing protein [Blautia sp. MSJ-19]